MSLSLENQLLLGDSSSSSLEGEELPQQLTLHVKSFQNVDIVVPNNASVSQLKQVVRTALGPSTENRYLRLICKGRLLAPDTAIIRDFNLKTGDVLHAVLAAAGVRGGQQAALARGATRRYRGTGVGPMGRIVRPSDEDTGDSEDEADEEEGRERLGFDRLRAVCHLFLLLVTFLVYIVLTFILLIIVWFESTRNYCHSILFLSSSRYVRGRESYRWPRRIRLVEKTTASRGCMDAITRTHLGISSQSESKQSFNEIQCRTLSIACWK